MTYEQLTIEFREIIAKTEALGNAKNLSLAEIVALMAQIQVRQMKMISYLMVEVERLKVKEVER